MRRAFLPCLAGFALVLALASAGQSASRGTTPQGDKRAALRMTSDWLATYPARVWGGVALPGDCRTLAGGRRACPIAIVLRAWTQGRRLPWRCEARAILPAAGDSAAPRRTSARCHLVDAVLSASP